MPGERRRSRDRAPTGGKDVERRRQARPDDLRHHYAPVPIDGGESMKVVLERPGQGSATEALDTYAHLWPSSDERTRSVVERAWTDAPAERVRSAEGQ